MIYNLLYLKNVNTQATYACLKMVESPNPDTNQFTSWRRTSLQVTKVQAEKQTKKTQANLCLWGKWHGPSVQKNLHQSQAFHIRPSSTPNLRSKSIKIVSVSGQTNLASGQRLQFANWKSMGKSPSFSVNQRN